MRSPLQGIGSHWDEWFTHDASTTDREAIEAVGANKFEQRRFISWLACHWAAEAQWHGEAPSGRYALSQLSRVAPFDKWQAFERYRTTYGAPGIFAIVIDEQSTGESTDVRRVESLFLPPDEDAAASNVVTEGFHAESADLTAARKAALGVLDGKGLAEFLALWLVTGRRPYPRWLGGLLLIGWLALIAIIVRLLVGSDPGRRLTMLIGLLFGIWSLLVITALTVAIVVGAQAWLVGRRWRTRLETSQTRLRINGGLSLQGGSAGLTFCLNILLATYRSHPRLPNRSWLWERFFRNLRVATNNWAATGVVSESGRIEKVAIEPKLRACLRHPEITDVITPWQPEARQSVVDRLMLGNVRRVREGAIGAGMKPAFASQRQPLRTHRNRYVAQSVLTIGNLVSTRQLAANVLALGVSIVMLLAMPDILNVLYPPPPPAAVQPSSPSPYFLWVSLDTKRPSAFDVAFESGFWSNRRANVAHYSDPDGSVRAEIRLNRLARQTTIDEQDGTVWVERRRKFLGRDYASGERVGTYSLYHINRLGND